jgi:hypothetical protein
VTDAPTRPTPDTLAYRLGLRLGRFVRVAVVAVFTSVAGVVIGGTSHGGFSRPLLYASIVVGALAMLLVALRSRVRESLPWGVYIVLVGIGSVLQRQEPRPNGALIGIAVGTIVASVAGVFFTVRAGRAKRELDRMLFTEATSVAFFVTMMSSLGYALLEVWIDAPRLSMWFVWTVGMGAWIVTSTIFRRRYS